MHRSNDCKNNYCYGGRASLVENEIQQRICPNEEIERENERNTSRSSVNCLAELKLHLFFLQLTKC